MQNKAKADMEERYHNWTNALAWQFVIAINVGKEVAGETYLKKLEEAFYKYGVRCTDYWRKAAGIEEPEPDCLVLGKLMDAVDGSFANWWEGYVKNTPEAFEKHIINCPIADIVKWAPEYCERLVPAALQGILQTLNPKASITFDNFMSKGDKTCHYRVETNA
jgi:predicted ArsR family transcriptional regulator